MQAAALFDPRVHIRPARERTRRPALHRTVSISLLDAQRLERSPLARDHNRRNRIVATWIRKN
jgi:hypothetical protein